MDFGDLIRSALSTLWAYRRRTGLTMFGIAWGIVSITLLVGAGEGLRDGQQKQADNLGKDIMIVFAGRTSMQAGGTRAGRVMRWQDTDHLAMAGQSPSCRWVLPEMGRNLSVRSAYNSASLLVTGSLPPFADIRSIAVAEGRFYNWKDANDSRRVAFVGSDSKKQLFGSHSAPGETLTIAGVPYTVIGVMQAKDQDSSYDGRDVSKVYIPFGAMMRDFPMKAPAGPHDLDQFLVQPRSDAEHLACKAEIRASLARLHDFDPADKEAVPIWDTIENQKAFRAMTDGMKYFLGAVGITTLLLGGLGVMNVMLVAVRERTREIGVRKALGATRGSILRQFFCEAMLIVLFSGAVGLGVAWGICAAVNKLPMPAFFTGLLPTWESSVLSFVLLGTVALGSALYPARRAASVDPIEALRFEAGG
jgi:putative ABC transport system permease protein